MDSPVDRPRSDRVLTREPADPATPPSGDGSLDHPLRTLESMEQYRRLRERDLRLFAAKLREPGGMIHRLCPACSADDPSTLFIKEGFDFARCGPCGCVYVVPVPNPALLDWYYDKSEALAFFHEHVLKPSLPQRRAIFADRVQQLKPFLPAGARILEIGTSIGLFVEAAQAAGYVVSGVEPNAGLARSTAAAYGVRIANCFFERYDSPDSPDAIVLWEVIEHMIDPASAIQKAHRMLPAGGLLAMTLPNLAGIEFALCGPGHEMIEGPSHLNYFTPVTISALLERRGFKVETLATPGILDYANVVNHLRRQSSSEPPEQAFWPAAPKGPGDVGSAFLLWLLGQCTEAERREMDRLATRVIQRSSMSGNLFVVARRT